MKSINGINYTWDDFDRSPAPALTFEASDLATEVALAPPWTLRRSGR